STLSSFCWHADHLYLHSFPTRRSSDLVFTPKSTPRDELRAGEVGFIIAGIKELAAAKVGDTVTLEKKLPNNAGPASEALPGFKEDRKSTRLNSSHVKISYAVFCLKKKK